MSVVLRCAGAVPLEAPPAREPEAELGFAERFLIWALRRHMLEVRDPTAAHLLCDAFCAAGLTRSWDAFDACGNLLAAAAPGLIGRQDGAMGPGPSAPEIALLQATALLQAGAPAPAALALRGVLPPTLARVMADPLAAFARGYADRGYLLPIRLELMQAPCAVH